MIKRNVRRNKSGRLVIMLLIVFVFLGAGAVLLFWRDRIFASTSFEIDDELGGNIFPSLMLSTATTDARILPGAPRHSLGNPKWGISITITSPLPNARLTVEVGETPFFKHSVSEFILPQKDTTYVVYPDIVWNYDALRANLQAEPISMTITAHIKDREAQQRVRTFSVRSVNECMIGYVDKANAFHNTGVLFAAYVNEDSPLIDDVLRQALNTRIVNRFMGYQHQSKTSVEKQVYALWHVLQQRKFRYSSISNSSLSSNVVYAQRVRTFEDALSSAQVNCVDGSVLFASLLRAVNIDPILVRVPGHMYVGYYTDRQHTRKRFIETTMIGDIDLDDFFPQEKLDSTTQGKSQREMSSITFQKAQEYAERNYQRDSVLIHSRPRQYMYLEISKNLRRQIQPLGK